MDISSDSPHMFHPSISKLVIQESSGRRFSCVSSERFKLPSRSTLKPQVLPNSCIYLHSFLPQEFIVEKEKFRWGLCTLVGAQISLPLNVWRWPLRIPFCNRLITVAQTRTTLRKRCAIQHEHVPHYLMNQKCPWFYIDFHCFFQILPLWASQNEWLESSTFCKIVLKIMYEFIDAAQLRDEHSSFCSGEPIHSQIFLFHQSPPRRHRIYSDLLWNHFVIPVRSLDLSVFIDWFFHDCILLNDLNFFPIWVSFQVLMQQVVWTYWIYFVLYYTATWKGFYY